MWHWHLKAVDVESASTREAARRLLQNKYRKHTSILSILRLSERKQQDGLEKHPHEGGFVEIGDAPMDAVRKRTGPAKSTDPLLCLLGANCKIAGCTKRHSILDKTKQPEGPANPKRGDTGTKEILLGGADETLDQTAEKLLKIRARTVAQETLSRLERRLAQLGPGNVSDRMKSIEEKLRAKCRSIIDSTS